MNTIYLKSWSSVWVMIRYDADAGSISRILASAKHLCNGFAYKFSGSWILVYVLGSRIVVTIGEKSYSLGELEVVVTPESKRKILIDINADGRNVVHGHQSLFSIDYLMPAAEIAEENFFLWLSDLSSNASSREDMIRFWNKNRGTHQ